MTTHVGYKKCRGDRIVKLRIEGDNNELRESVKRANAKFAKFRCSRATVLDIYDSKNRAKFKSALSEYDNSFYYTIGQVVKVDNYEKNIDRVCTTGIHYYLSEEAAIGYDGAFVGIIKDNEEVKYNKNGVLFVRSELVDGVKNGKSEQYFDSGQLSHHITYKNGVAEGLCHSYYRSGQIQSRRTYKNNRVHGESVTYYENGGIERSITYENGCQI